MRQEFLVKLTSCGNDKQRLTALLAEIDEQKRSLKSRLSRMSSEPEGEFGRGRMRQEQIRKMKDKASFLTQEREIVRAKLGSLKMDQKALNRAVNNRCAEFAHAFIAAAQRLLSDEQFMELELRAAEIISSKAHGEPKDQLNATAWMVGSSGR
jgi:inorganic triphosphatase YgiF